MNSTKFQINLFSFLILGFSLQSESVFAKAVKNSQNSLVRENNPTSKVKSKHPLILKIQKNRQGKNQNQDDSQLVYGPGFYGGNILRCNLGDNQNTSITYRHVENPTEYGSTVQPYLNPPLNIPEPTGAVNIIGNDAYMTYRKKTHTHVGIPIRFTVPGDQVPVPSYYILGTQFSYKLEHVSGSQYNLPIIEAVYLMPLFPSKSSVIYGAAQQHYPESTAFGATLDSVFNGIGWYPYQNLFDFNVTPPYIACVILKIPPPENVTGEQVIRFTPLNFVEPMTVGGRDQYIPDPESAIMDIYQGDIYLRIDPAN